MSGAWPPPPAEGPFGMPPPAFYPLTIGRGISLTFHLFRFGWRTFVGIALLTTIPLAIIVGIGQFVTYGEMARWQLAAFPDPFSTPTDPRTLLATFPWWVLGVSLLGSFLGGIFSTLGGAALIDAINAAISGRKVNMGESIGAAVNRLGSLVGLYLLLTLLSTVVALAGVVLPLLNVFAAALELSGGPLIFLALVVFVAVLFAFLFAMIRFAFAMQTLMIEGLGVIDALRRSWSLLTGSMLRLIGWMLVFLLIVGLLSLAIGIPLFLVALVVSPPTLANGFSFSVEMTVIQTVTTTIVDAVLSSLVAIATTLLYFDIRWRRGETVPAPGGGVSAGQPPPVYRPPAY